MLWLQSGLPKSPANVVAAIWVYCKLLLLKLLSDANSNLGLPQMPLLQVGSDANSYLGRLQRLFLECESSANGSCGLLQMPLLQLGPAANCCPYKLALMQAAT